MALPNEALHPTAHPASLRSAGRPAGEPRVGRLPIIKALLTGRLKGNAVRE